MAMFTSHHTNEHAHKTHSPFSTAWGAITHGIEEVRASWRRRRTAEMIESMSPDLRKDIGWPTSDIVSEKNDGIRH